MVFKSDIGMILKVEMLELSCFVDIEFKELPQQFCISWLKPQPSRAKSQTRPRVPQKSHNFYWSYLFPRRRPLTIPPASDREPPCKDLDGKLVSFLCQPHF